jgi:hypothetical protein
LRGVVVVLPLPLDLDLDFDFDFDLPDDPLGLLEPVELCDEGCCVFGGPLVCGGDRGVEVV